MTDRFLNFNKSKKGLKKLNSQKAVKNTGYRKDTFKRGSKGFGSNREKEGNSLPTPQIPPPPGLVLVQVATHTHTKIHTEAEIV